MNKKKTTPENPEAESAAEAPVETPTTSEVLPASPTAAAGLVPAPVVEEKLAESAALNTASPESDLEIEVAQPPEVETTSVENTMALSVSAQHDAEIENSMVIGLAAGQNLSAENSFLGSAAVGGGLKIEDSGAGVLVVGGQAEIKHGTIGLLIAKSEANLTDSRILMTTPQAIALGAAFGTVYALLRVLLGGKKRK